MKSDFKKLENRGWSDMHQTLEREMPHAAPPRRALPIWWVSLGIFIGGAAVFLFFQSKIQTLENQLVIQNKKENMKSSSTDLTKNFERKNLNKNTQELPNLLKKPSSHFSATQSLTFQNLRTQPVFEPTFLAPTYGTSQSSDATKASDTGGGDFLKSEKNEIAKISNFEEKNELNLLKLRKVNFESIDSNTNFSEQIKLKSNELVERSMHTPTRPIGKLTPRPSWEIHMNQMFDFKSFGGVELGVAQTRFIGSSRRLAWQWGISGSLVLKNDETWSYLEIIRNIDKTRPTLVPLKVDAYGLPYQMREMYYLNIPIRVLAQLDDHWWISGGVKMSGLVDYHLTNLVNLDPNFYGYGTQNHSNEPLMIGKYYLANKNYGTVTAPLQIRRFDVAQLIGLSYRAASGFQSEFFYQHGWFSPSRERTTEQNTPTQRFNRVVGLRLSMPIR